METSKTEGKRRMKEVGKEEDKGEEEEEEEEFAVEDADTIGEDSKRKRAALTVSQKRVSSVAAAGSVIQPSCQVEDCKADLKDGKQYHRRHKVCEHHSKAPLVLIAGIRQRFCQQCSRFHDISEFDDTKRSCRRRLAGHNERRRKSSYDSNGDG